MATDPYLTFYIVLLALAMSMFGSVLHAKSRSDAGARSKAGRDTLRFEDCYDLCQQRFDLEPTRSCSTMCFSHLGA